MRTRRPGIGALVFAWAGAALFLLSLLAFLYLYGIAFGPAAASQPAWPAILIDVALFSVFALHHSLLARTGLKRIITRIVPPWLERSTFTWTASVLFLLVSVAWQPVDGTLYALPGVFKAIGYAVQVTGILLTAAASSAIDVLHLSGVRQVLDARAGTAPPHAALKVDGVYRVVRHPLYSGWALFVFGAPDMNGTRLLYALVSTTYLALAIPFEERSLVEVFGDAYREYQRTTRWRMVPGVW